MSSQGTGNVPPPNSTQLPSLANVTVSLISSPAGEDGAGRVNAEAYLSSYVERDPAYVVLALLYDAQNFSLAKDVRQQSAVLLRPLIAVNEKDSRSKWDGLPDAVKNSVKAGILSALDAEVDKKIHNLLCDCASDLGAGLFAAGTWPELLPFLFKCSNSQKALHRCTALQIMAQLALSQGDSAFRKYFRYIISILGAGLIDADTQVRLEALMATTAFLQVLEQPEETREFQQFIPQMLACLSYLLNQGLEGEARTALEVFVDLAENAPLFFRPAMTQVTSAMMTIASPASHLELDTRRFALEVLLILCQERPGAIKKVPNLISQLMSLVLTWLLEITDDESWYQFVEETELTVSQYGEDALDRLSDIFGGKVIVPILFGHIPALVSNATEWNHRYAAAMAISSCGEGCKFVLKHHINDMLKIVLPLMEDAHPRVRWAAINCVGQLFTDFAPEILDQYGSQLVPQILGHMKDSCARVQVHCCTAMINFADKDLGGTNLLPMLDTVLPCLAAMLQAPTSNVPQQELVLAALSSCVSAVGEKFSKYYDTYVPYLKSIISNAKSKEYRALRGSAMDCLSVIGLAVRKERFFNDAQEVMQEMLKTTVLDADDPQIFYMETALGRIAECLGVDFAPFLPLVMQPSIARAAIIPDMFAKEDDDEKHSNTHTSELDDKANAAHNILLYATHSKQHFFPYIEEVTKIFVRDMNFPFHEGVRTAAAASPPILISCLMEYLKASGVSDLQLVINLWHSLFEALLKTMIDETDIEVLAVQIASIAEAMDVISKPCLTAEHVQNLIKIGHKIIQDWKQRRDIREETKKKIEYDEEELEKLSEVEVEEDDILAQLVECFSHLVQLHREVYIPAFLEHLLSDVADMLTPDKSWNERQKGLCFFDDIVEYAGAAAVPILPHFLSPLFQYTQDEMPELRQAAAFGLGICSQNLGEVFSGLAAEALRLILKSLQMKNSRSTEDQTRATENAVSAAVKICRYNYNRVNVAEAMPLLLANMPMQEDSEEGRVCHENLLFMLENPDMSSPVIGANFANAPRIILILAHVVETEMMFPESAPRVALLLRRMQTTLPGPVLQTALTSLTPELVNKVNALLQKNP
ncbi:ARM family protein [Pelomyxa schiedti]|nr:ARM family protein [Pelomyxa schiedti]